MDENREDPVFPTMRMTRRFSLGDADSFIDVCFQCPEQPCKHMVRRKFSRPKIDYDEPQSEQVSEPVVKSARYRVPYLAVSEPIQMCKPCNSDEASSTSRKNVLNTSESSEDNELHSNSDQDPYLTLPKLEIEEVNSTSIRRHQVRRMSEMIKIHGIRDDDGEESDGYKYDLGKDDDDGSNSDEDNESGRKSYENLPSRLNKSDDFGHPDDRRANKMSDEDMEKNVMQWLKLEPLEIESAKKTNVTTWEEAMDQIKFGRCNYFVIWIAGLIIMAGFTEACGVSYIMPVSQCDLDLTTHHKGILGAVSLLGTLCSAYMWGYLADKNGRRFIIRPTLTASVILSIVSSFVKDFYVFAILRFFVGFFMSGSTSCIYAYLSEFHGKRDRSRSIMYASVVFGLLSFILPFVAYAVINERWHYFIPGIGVTYKPWRFFLVVCTLMEMTALACISIMPESPRYLLLHGQKAEVIRILEWMNRWNNGKNAKKLDIEDIVDDEQETGGNNDDFESAKKNVPDTWSVRLMQRAPLLQPRYLRPLVLICTLQFWIVYTSNGFYIFFNEIMNRMATNLNSFTEQRMDMCVNINLHHQKAKEFAVGNGTLVKPPCVDRLELETLFFALIKEGLYPIGFVLISVLIIRVPRFHILFTLLFSTGVAAIACDLTDIPLVQASAFIFFECAGIASKIVNTCAVELFPTHIRAVAMSIASTIARLGGVTGSNVTGALLDHHCKIAFYIPGCALIASAILSYFVPNIRNRPSNRA